MSDEDRQFWMRVYVAAMENHGDPRIAKSCADTSLQHKHDSIDIDGNTF